MRLWHVSCVFLSMVVLSSCTSTPDRAAAAVLPKDPVLIVLHQRSDAAIPGSQGQIRIKLGDITGGQVMLSVTKGEDELLVEARSVRAGDVVEVTYAGEKLYVKVVRLCNFMLGDDFGEFAISKSPQEPEASSADGSQPHVGAGR